MVSLIRHCEGLCKLTSAELPSLVNDILSGFFAFSLKSETFVGFETLLSHAIPSVRLRALDLLVASKSPNASIHPETFRCLIRVLPNLHDDTDAFHRGELFSVFRRFLIRIQQSHRMLNKDQAKDNLNDMLREYTTFCSRYCAFLKSEVLVHISYGRHILSLDLLNFISEQIWPQEAFATVSLSDEDFLATLFRLVLDPYDDIRAVSTNVLLNIANVRSVDFNLALERTNPMTSTSQLAAATNRADHADALGRLIALLQENSVISRRTTSEDKGSFLDLQEQVTALSAYIQGANNLDVTITYPLHGSILGMRYLLESSTLNYPSTTMAMWKEPLLVACQKIWTLSQPHLCVDSPEVEEDATDELGSSGPKDLLAYAWRALRDVHLMMQAMLDTSMADHAVFSTIGRMCFDQLALLRHRGAFSTVAQSFVLCCQKCRSSDDPDVQSLTSQWFGSALAELQKQADRLTRRSAGLPAMFTALLDPHDDHKFSLCVQELVQIAVQLAPDPRGAEAEDKLRLPQVHALNCLKDIMTTSRFRIRTAPLVVPMVDLAAQCMSSHIWAIKNCGLMLLRASINRLDPDTGVGGSKADVNIRALSDSGRQLSDVALSLLSSWSLETSASEEFVQAYSQDGNRIDDGNEAVFAGLDLIGRLYLNKDERLSVRDTVARQLGSHLWHIRAQAARLLTTTTPQDEQIAVVQEMLRRLNKSSSLNECHGKMLVVRGLLTSLQEGPISLEFLSSFAQSLVEASCAAPVALNKTFLATWLEIANQLISSTPANSTIPARLYETFSKQLNGFSSDDDQPVALYDRALAYFMLQVHVLTGSLTHDQAARYVGKDNDTIAYVFEQRQSSKSTAQSRRYFNVVKEVLQSTEMAQARPILLKRAVTCINSGLALPDTTDFTTLIDALQFEQSISRDIMIAQFSLYTALCKIAMQWNGVTTNRLRELSIGFCRHLKFAAADDTEEPTRCAVVEALQQWQDLALLDDMFNAIFESHGKLEVFSVLYDLLNDDDDEIRGKAGEVAAAFHQSNMRGSRRKIVLCAFAARQRLRDHGFRAFMGTEMLGLECVRRILNIRSKESPMQMKKEVVRYCQHNTIEKQILGVMAAANDLFAEEKQNLYIDEIVELKVWARVLTDMQCRIPDELVKVLSKWADDGLRSAHNLLEKVNGKLDQNNWEVEAAVLADKTATDLNISFTPELEILLVRVVAIAGILVQSGDSQRQEQDGVASKVLVSLQKLHEKCGSMSVPASLRESLHLII